MREWWLGVGEMASLELNRCLEWLPCESFVEYWWMLISHAILTLSLPRMINFKFLLQPHHKCYTTQYQELGFSSLTQMKDDYTINSHYLTYTFLFKRLGECTFWTYGSERVKMHEWPKRGRGFVWESLRWPIVGFQSSQNQAVVGSLSRLLENVWPSPLKRPHSIFLLFKIFLRRLGFTYTWHISINIHFCENSSLLVLLYRELSPFAGVTGF